MERNIKSVAAAKFLMIASKIIAVILKIPLRFVVSVQLFSPAVLMHAKGS